VNLLLLTHTLLTCDILVKLFYLIKTCSKPFTMYVYNENTNMFIRIDYCGHKLNTVYISQYIVTYPNKYISGENSDIMSICAAPCRLKYKHAMCWNMIDISLGILFLPAL
jgi:hypothetical protein